MVDWKEKNKIRHALGCITFRLPLINKSLNVVYRFTCTCGMQYIGLTERRLQDRVREHLPRWLTGTLDGIARSSITEHVLETGHSCRPDSCFEILHRVRSRRMLKFMEAVSIRVNRPCLNVQKIHDFRLKLAWN